MSDLLKSRIRGDSEVRAYYDEPERHVVAVVEALGTPSRTLATYVTASLHASPNVMDGRDIRVELLMVGPEGEVRAANIVATAAFAVMKDGWLAAPGVVFPHAVRDYLPDTTVPHLMWVEPFDFDDLSTIEVDGVDHDVHVLQAMPLTEPERALLHDGGFDQLSARLESAGAAHYDLYRESVC